MFAPDTDYDPITPSTGHLLAEIGLDINAVRESITDDIVRRCPDREILADQAPPEESERRA